MKIVIAGGGDIGFHLAELLAAENQDITLIDTDRAVLEHVNRHLDVLTVYGDSTSFEVLNSALVSKAQLLIAVTTSEKTNLLTASISKSLGAKQTIARVNNPEYLTAENKPTFLDIGIDTLISPQFLAGREIGRLLESSSFTDIFHFENGLISLVGFFVLGTSPLIGKTIKKIDESTPDFHFKAIAIQRGNRTIIANSKIRLQRGDRIYLVARKDNLDKVNAFVGKTLKKVKTVMILGGTSLAYITARQIENNYSVTLIEGDRNRAKSLVQSLQKTLVINADPGNLDILKEEGLERMDALISLTSNSETNIINCVMANEMKIYKTIASVDNAAYTKISQNIGVDTIINTKILAANSIFRFVRKGVVEAIASLHGVEGEIIEFIIHKKNRLTRNPLKDLHFTDRAVVAAVIRDKISILPDGDFQFQLDDKAIVFAFKDAIPKVEKLFR